MTIDGRLTTELEVAGLIRSIQGLGGHAAVLRKGDAERGALVLLIASRGELVACFERIPDLGGGYIWRESGQDLVANPAKVAEFLAKRARFDADYWALELDIADPERFIAEKLRAG